MNKRITIATLKAGNLTCLFLFLSVMCSGQNWLNTRSLQQAHTDALNLNTVEIKPSGDTSPQWLYVESLGEALKAMITEDEARFDKFEEGHERRINHLKKQAGSDNLFALAELRLHAAFVYLKFGHEFDAAWSIRQAYNTVATCKKNFSTFKSIKKTAALLEIMVGSVPEKYHWILSLLNMHGSTTKGIQMLAEFQTEDTSLQLETRLLYYLIHGYILQETSLAVEGMQIMAQEHPDNQLVLFLTASLALKNAKSELALEYLSHLVKIKTGVTIPFSNYFLGEVYLQKGSYEMAIRHYHQFLDHYSGISYRKDAYFKIGMCYWLQTNEVKANEYFNRARNEGSELTEADKHAARVLTYPELPHRQLTKARYATDGGYYDKAENILRVVSPDQLTKNKEKTEFYYRLARLHHQTQKTDSAKVYYIKTIEIAQQEPWYFAPNACLQLGYLLEKENKSTEARYYFSKALTYKKHEYKNSIDAKAKSALNRIDTAH